MRIYLCFVLSLTCSQLFCDSAPQLSGVQDLPAPKRMEVTTVIANINNNSEPISMLKFRYLVTNKAETREGTALKDSSTDDIVDEYFGLIKFSSGSPYNLLKAKLPTSFFYDENSQEKAEADTNALLETLTTELTVAESAYGYQCYFLLSPSNLKLTTKVGNQTTVKFDVDPKLDCRKKKYRIQGTLSIKPRGFEFYNSINFYIAAKTEDNQGNALSDTYVTYLMDIKREQFDDEGYGPSISFDLNNAISFGTEIIIEAVCKTSDYYACSIDYGKGAVNDDLEIEVKCRPRSKKYDKLYTAAWVLAVGFVATLVAAIGLHYKRNSHR